jgi:hypothetical protein
VWPLFAFMRGNAQQSLRVAALLVCVIAYNSFQTCDWGGHAQSAEMGSFGSVRGGAGGAAPLAGRERGARRHVVVVVHGRSRDRFRSLARCSVVEEATGEPTIGAAALVK